MKKILKWLPHFVGFFLFFVCITISACSTGKPKNTDNAPIDQNALNTQVASTIFAGMTQTAQTNITPIPEATIVPANATDNTKLSSSTDMWAKNYVGSVESGGVVVEIARVAVTYKEAYSTDFDWHALDDYIPEWENTEVIGELTFKITNNNSFTVNIYPNFGSVQVGAEQIELDNYSAYTPFGDDLQGEIYPGVTKIGGIWFGIKRSTPEIINQMIYRCDAPSDIASYLPLSQNIEININLQDHLFEEMPEELK